MLLSCAYDEKKNRRPGASSLSQPWTRIVWTLSHIWRSWSDATRGLLWKNLTQGFSVSSYMVTLVRSSKHYMLVNQTKLTNWLVPQCQGASDAALYVKWAVEVQGCAKGTIVSLPCTLRNLSVVSSSSKVCTIKIGRRSLIPQWI